MIRTFLAGLCLAAFALFVLLFVSVPGWTKSPGLHPDCNVTMPCIGPVASVKPTSRREARRIARGQRLEQAIAFGAPWLWVLLAVVVVAAFLAGAVTS